MRRHLASCTVAAAWMLGLFTACGADGPGAAPGGPTQDVVGGDPSPHGYPAIVYVNPPGGGTCSGTLISKRWVLTAKHCGNAPSVYVWPNSNPGRSVPVDRWEPFGGADLLLLHLAAPVNDVRPLSIAIDPPSVGQACVAVGFGINDRGSDGLGYGTVVVNKLTPPLIEVRPGSGIPRGGDSGGPLLCGDRVYGVAKSVGPGQHDKTTIDATDRAYYVPVNTALWDVNGNGYTADWIARIVWEDVAEPAIAAISGGPNYQDVFVRGTDGQVYHKWRTGGDWFPYNGPWEALGGYLTGTPEVVTWGGARIDVFVRGGDPDPQRDTSDSLGIYHLSWNGSQWVWEGALTEPVLGHPSAVAWKYATAVFGVRASAQDVIAVWGTNGSWQSMTLATVDEGGNPLQFAGPLKAVNNGSNVFVFAVATNGSLYWTQAALSGPYPSRWGYWQGLGGVVPGTPAVVRNGSRFEVYVRGTDNGVWRKSRDSSGNWLPSQYGWDPIGGTMISGPSMVATMSGQLQLVAADANENWWYKGFYATGAQPAWQQSGWGVGTPTLLEVPPPATGGSELIEALGVDHNFTPYCMSHTSTGWYACTSYVGMGGRISLW